MAYEINMTVDRAPESAWFLRGDYPLSDGAWRNSALRKNVHVDGRGEGVARATSSRTEETYLVLRERDGDILTPELLKDGLVQFGLRLGEMCNLHPGFDGNGDG